ncbi:ArsR/SmtB family transcription factor [Rhizobium sp. LEGMi198b]|uniref:ArsR/SmtB family transcription factor n=1 Tax=unclassified Rhizobium TaxID=2613769 RepID=UPI000CDF3922|nr:MULTISPECIES: metalloregulator ArsR/SmtB family transcription factor [Rhizobium]AVA21833.1 ArsR family transcriptional regulator protein [Rhizobium sp. NXC24]MDK4737759.1 metalloregulator ArsR/SmtB family transcription factor [Rhizobium sp. CNPSo 3464]UWU22885.1 metalloregulator ArsR/SmtB family transcription factor [Rhizobium tropici]WFU03672.1 metalloregulator ArsR/SmtB family transcription factor [Rhizobium sp. CB3171]
MVEDSIALDRMFQALSDQSRRGMIDRLGRGPASVMELAQPFAMALPTVMKHLHVLETSGLVRSEKIGRVRTYQLRKEALEQVERWIAERRAGWNRTFDRLDQFLADNSEETAVK